MSSRSLDLNRLFKVSAPPSNWRNIIPPRKGPVRPLVGVTMYDAYKMKEKAFEAAGLTDYMDCWTFEPARRPIQFVSRDPKPARALAIFEKHIGAILDYLLPQVQPHIQTYNKVSALGYPIHENPHKDNQKSTDVAVERIFKEQNLNLKFLRAEGLRDKFDVTKALFSEMDVDDFSRYNDSFSTQSGRLQNELPDKIRTFQFITSQGYIYEDTVGRKEKTEHIGELGRDMVGSRYRGVTNPAVINLYNQVWDSMLHNVVMNHPLCDANMYVKTEWDTFEDVEAFDCKHYERYLGRLVLAYAKAIGGQYEELLTKLVMDPYLMLSDDRAAAFLLRATFAEGTYPQFGSGISCVSILGKLAGVAVDVEFLTDRHHLSQRDAVAAAFAGQHKGLRRWQYGDDRRIKGPKQDRKDYLSFVGDVFDIEGDPLKKYLGFIAREDIKRYVLPAETYDLKLYQPERDWNWRTYPHLGATKRREVFIEYGEPEIAQEIIPLEDQLYEMVDVPFDTIVAAAGAEQRKAEQSGVKITDKEATDKRHLMTTKEELATGMFSQLPQNDTARIALKLVSSMVRQKLKFN